MKVLVIGGTLFIGRQLVKELRNAGHDVAVLHRQPKHGMTLRIENLVADRNDPEAVRQVLAGRRFEVVYDNVYDWERGTTAAQVEATVRACGDRVSRYIFMSSVAAYGDGLNHYEGDALAPDNHADAYVRNKAMTERMLFRLHQKHGLPVVTFRPPYVYGPGNPFYREAFFWDRLRLGRPIIIPGDGHRLMQFAYVKDLVRAMVRAMEVPNAEGEAFNIGDSRPLTQAELVQALAAAANKTANLVRVPRETILQAGGNPMGEPAYFGVYFDLPPITEKMGKAARVLGVRPTPFEVGLKETWRWYLRNHKRTQPGFAFEDRLLDLAAARTAGVFWDMALQLDEAEVRVLGALMEKEITTPEYYPLSLNALVNACNQKSNRDPVVAYDEQTVEAALSDLRAKGLAIRISGHDMRVPKHQHRLSESFNLGRREAAVLCTLMLRGPQTVGELRGRTERLYEFDDLAAVEACLNRLIEWQPDPLAATLPRQAGYKETRFAHLLSGEPRAQAAQAPILRDDPLARLQSTVENLEREVAELRRQFAEFRKQFE